MFWCCNCVFFPNYWFFEDVQLHVLILSTSHPSVMCLLSVYLLPHQAWVPRYVIVGCQCMLDNFSCFSSIFVFWWKQICTLVLPFHSALLWNVCSGNAARPSNIFPKPHTLQSLHAHTCKKNNQVHSHPPASLPPSAIHAVSFHKSRHSPIHSLQTH